MTADQRRRSKKRSSKAVGNQDAEFDQTEFASRYWLDESLPVLSRPEEIFGDILLIKKMDESLKDCNLIFDSNYLTNKEIINCIDKLKNRNCLLYTSPSPRD